MTEREQLIELRKEILIERMKGKDQAAIDRATKHLDRMKFKDHADFIAYVDDTAEGITIDEAVATEAEVDEILRLRGQNKPSGNQAKLSDMEAMFKDFKI